MLLFYILSGVILLVPLVAVILSVTVLGEPMSLTQILGGLMILGFTLWNELDNK